LRIGILTRNANAWAPQQLKASCIKLGVEPFFFRFNDLTARVNLQKPVTALGLNLAVDLSALIVRPIGRGSIDECVFRIDVLHKLHRLGLTIINNPSAIERSMDKYYAISLLNEHGIPVPRTIVTESPASALEAFDELGGDVVCKPMFGARGLGVTRLTDRETASRVFRALAFTRNVIYVQEFIPHGVKDIRAFVVGDGVVAAMYRVAQSWKTNVAQGAKPIPLNLTGEAMELAIKSAKLLGCEIAGVDILESKNGFYVVEINSQPGWHGLQSVTSINIADAIINYVISKVKR